MTEVTFDRTTTGNYRVFKRLPWTPASEAGLREGDVVTMINGEPATEISRDRLRDLVTGKSGRILHLPVERSGGPVAISVSLRETV